MQGNGMRGRSVMAVPRGCLTVQGKPCWDCDPVMPAEWQECPTAIALPKHMRCRTW